MPSLLTVRKFGRVQKRRSFEVPLCALLAEFFGVVCAGEELPESFDGLFCGEGWAAVGA